MRATRATSPSRTSPAFRCVRHLTALLALCLPITSSAQEAVLPFAVLKDGDGQVVGPLVGFTLSIYPIVRIIDPGTGAPVFLEVRRTDTFRAAVLETFHSQAGCVGAAYHDPALAGDADLLPSSTGSSYSLSGLDLYRSDSTDPGTPTPYSSRSTFGACFASESGEKVLRPAELVLDLAEAHPPPMRVE